MLLRSRLEALGRLILEICNVSGVPGVSLGILHHGEIVHQVGYGFRDVDAQLPPNENTTFVIGSLTKAVTAAMVGILVEDGKLEWTTQLHDVIPEFTRDEKLMEPTLNVTITDLLSHRTGLPSYDSLWLHSDNYIPLNRSQAAPILSYVPVAYALRTEFLYNNMAYEVIGQVVEKLSGVKYAEFLQDRILNPLQLNRTFYTDEARDENAAKAYAALDDGLPVEIPIPIHGKDVIMGAAGGIRSCVRDLLILYKAFMAAGDTAFGPHDSSTSSNPLKQLAHLWRGAVSMPFDSLREYSYASGWIRAELPGVIAYGAPYTPPTLGSGSPSRLMLYHQGCITGAVAYVALFPETSSAVVVLANSASLTDAIRLIGQLAVETLFGSSINSTDYIQTASTSAADGASYMSTVRQALKRGKPVYEPKRPLHAYTGRYFNSIGNYFIDVLQNCNGIQISYMGLERDTFKLETYQDDSFFWSMTHNECVRRARFPTFPKEYYVVKFGCESSGDAWGFSENFGMECLVWKHEFELPGDGEVFRKRKYNGRANQTRSCLQRYVSNFLRSARYGT